MLFEQNKNKTKMQEATNMTTGSGFDIDDFNNPHEALEIQRVQNE